MNMRVLALLHMYFMVLDVQARNVLPTPDNVTLLSNNFNHILSWSPGRGSPPGIVYRVSVREKRKETFYEETKKTTIDISKYMPDILHQYAVRLSALFGNMSSTVIRRNITPFTDTIIGPPAVAVFGCGNCFNISVSLPVREGLRNHEDFYRTVKFNLHLKKTGDEKDITVMCEYPKEGETLLMPLKCFVGNLQPGGNYCVQAQPQLSINEKTRPSDWVCAFTSTEEERGVALVAGWTIGSVLVGLGLLIITASLVYTRYLCRSRMDLPKALTSVVPARYLFLEETQLSVAKADTTLKSNRPKQVHQTQEQTDREEDEDEDDDEDNNDYNKENCNYMIRGISDTDSQATNSGQSSTSTATTLFEEVENSERCSEEFPSVEAEAEPAPSSSTALSQLLNQHLTGNTQVTMADLRPEKPNTPTLREMGPDGGQNKGAEAGFSQNISLSSVRLMSLQTAEGDVSHAKDVSQPLLSLLRQEPDLSKPQTGKPTLPGLHTHFYFQRNVQAELRNKELPKQKHLPEPGSDQLARHDRTQGGYMATHRGKLDTESDCLLEENKEEEDEEEDYSSEYMKR